MRRTLNAAIYLVCMSCFANAPAQSNSVATVVPRLVSFSGQVNEASGKPLRSQLAITFSLYAEQQGGSALWSELQTVQPDAEGRYSVFLGATNAGGLPLDLFTTGAARWLAARPEVPGLEDPARILLVGVPYALKAADADTLGGKPASAFMTTESQLPPMVATGSAVAALSPIAQGVTSDVSPTGTGTTDYIPLWTSSSNLGNSVLYQSGNNIGIGTTTPGSPLTLSSLGNTFASGVSYMADFIGAGVGNNSGTTNYRGLDFNITAGGATAIQGFTSVTGDNFNSLNTGTVGTQTIFSGNLRVNNAGNTTSGYGFQVIPILSGKGGITSWEAFDARTPSISSTGGISNSYALYLEPQKVTGVMNGYGVYQAGASDTNYLAGKVGIGTASPGANLEVNGTAKFDGAVTFAGGQTDTGNVTASGELISTVAQGTAPLQVTSSTQVANLNASYLGGLASSAFAQVTASNTFVGTQSITGGLSLGGSINGSLLLQPNVTDPAMSYTGTNVIAGYSAGTLNSVRSGVTGATIGGGGLLSTSSNTNSPNTVTDDFGTVAGGTGNTAGQGNGRGYFATVSGGGYNTASAAYSSVVGGQSNSAIGQWGTVAGGINNTASGTLSIVANGQSNTASGYNSFAAGIGANATDYGSFVWCQIGGSACNSAGTNSFTVSVLGPIYFYDGTGGSGCYLSSGSGSWTCSSDRNLKDHIQTIDPQSVLESVARMPISQWSMKSDTKSNKHIGPMAQDFYAAFGLGETDKYIAQGDAQGIALASIQGLYRELKATKEELQQKDSQIRDLIQQKNETIQDVRQDLQHKDQEIRLLQDRLQVLEKLLLKK